MNSWRRLLVAAAFLLTGALTLRLVAHDHLEPRALLALMREWAAGGWGPLVFVAAYLVGTSLLVPAVAFHIVAGVLFGFGPGVAFSFLALNLVSNLHFGIGRAVGQQAVVDWLARRRWSFVSNELQQHGVLAMVAVRQLPLPFLAVNVAAGASGVAWRDFFFGSGLGALAPLLVYTSLATSLIDGVEGVGLIALARAAAGGFGMLVLAVAPRLWRRWRQTRPT